MGLRRTVSLGDTPRILNLSSYSPPPPWKFSISPINKTFLFGGGEEVMGSSPFPLLILPISFIPTASNCLRGSFRRSHTYTHKCIHTHTHKHTHSHTHSYTYLVMLTNSLCSLILEPSYDWMRLYVRPGPMGSQHTLPNPNSLQTI